MSGHEHQYPGEHEAKRIHVRIVRDGERLDLPNRMGEPGIGIRVEGEEWFASVPGAGFLELDEAGSASVVPIAFISENKLKAKLDFRQPQEGEAPLCREEVDASVAALGIEHGFNLSRIDAAWRVFDSRGVLMRSMRFASGTAPVLGVPSSIVYDERFSAPAKKEAAKSGEVDHHDRGGVLNVDEGERIGIWEPGEESSPGLGVDGVTIEVPASETLRPLKIGENIESFEDEDGQTILRSLKAGVLTIKGGEPHVSEVMTISGDVDYESGNVDVGGSVLVRGSVRAGFSVTARHSITVMGIVEGADLQAGGDMDLKKGLIGAEGTSVIVGGNLILKYAQNADIRCGGDVELLDADMGSTITASGDIRALSGRGRLRGGTYTAAKSISAKEIGSELGAHTHVACGVDVLKIAEVKKLTSLLNEINSGLQKLKRKPDQNNAAAQRKCAKKKRGLEKSQRPLLARLAVLNRAEESDEEPLPPSILATQRVYFGVEIEVEKVRLRPSETSGGRHFVLDARTGHIAAEQAQRKAS